MKLKALIVDDKPNFAKIVEIAVKNFHSSYDEITYEAIVISGIDVTARATEYILLHQNDIDLLLIDYNIETNVKSSDLFVLVDKSKFLIYKIQHSFTGDSHYQTRDSFKVLYDDSSKSKDGKDITLSLEKYENKILRIKLQGNPKFREACMVNATRIKEEVKEKKFARIPLLNILYAETDGKSRDKITIYFIDEETKNVRKETRSTHSIKDFTHSGIPFKRINQSMIINLLWVANINIPNRIIRFICLSNGIIEITYTPKDTCFNEEVLPCIPDINKYIPQFFKD